MVNELERPYRENRTAFSELPFVPGRIKKKNLYHLHPNRNFREFVEDGKQPL